MRCIQPLKKFDPTDHPALPILKAFGADGKAQDVSTAPISPLAESTLSFAFRAAAIFAVEDVVTTEPMFNGGVFGLSVHEVPFQFRYMVVPKAPIAPISANAPWL